MSAIDWLAISVSEHFELSLQSVSLSVVMVVVCDIASAD